MNKLNIRGVGKGWAWAITTISDDCWILCHWVCPTLKDLKSRGKPSPGARAVRVNIVPSNKK